jgi:glycine dehydrogenase subunit 2
MKQKELIFELSKPGRKGYSLPECDVPVQEINTLISDLYLRETDANLPEVSEVDVIRHFTALSKRNHGVDSGFYPLGSCTMKYNPKVNEDIAKLDSFQKTHPYQEIDTVQGSLELLYSMDKALSEITGMAQMSLQPAAGAHGELTGLMVIKAYHENRGDKSRNKIIVPDSAHGTNPASAAAIGYDVVEVKSNDRGGVDLGALKSLMDSNIAGLMLTNPNTLGLFDENIKEIADIIHQAGGLLYYDGANANAIMGISRPGDMGFDVVHLNLHKTFSTPHGGGGPGSGPIGVKKELIPFLPVPIISKSENKYYLDYDKPLSIGRVKNYYGNFGVIVKAYSYIMSMGAQGLRKASETAVLNANYIMNKLKDYYHLEYERTCMHEFVISAIKQKEDFDVSALDIAKSLIDYGYHPPTIYFPLIVKEAMMIEPTETEGKETLDAFIDAMIEIAKKAAQNSEEIKSAPYKTVVGRMDEVTAARNPILKYEARI